MIKQGDDIADQTVWLEMEEVDDGYLQVDRFVTRPGETWCVYGGNHSGIDRFVELFRRQNQAALSFRKLTIPLDLGVVSFKDQQELFEQEVRNDESDFLDRIDPGTLAGEFLTNPD
jgi:molybdate transport system ATP-binding protein